MRVYQKLATVPNIPTAPFTDKQLQDLRKVTTVIRRSVVFTVDTRGAK